MDNASHEDIVVQFSDGSNANSNNSKPSLIKRIWKFMFPYGYKSEFKALFALAWPAVLTSFFQFLMLSQNVIFSGHLGKEELDAVSLANSFINVLGFVIGIGLTTACDTLFSQTFGSSNKKRVGMYMQRSFLAMFMFIFPLWTIWLNIEPILIAIGQDPVVSSYCANYLTVAIPSLLFEYAFLIMARYMQNQGTVLPPMIAAICGNIVSAILQYLLIYVFNYGYIGSAIALNCGEFSMVLFELIYILASKMYKATWAGADREAVFDVAMFFRLAIPGVIMVSMETWSFEVGTLLSGLLGTVDLGAQSVVFQIDSLAFMVPLGMSIAVNIRVGQQLGEMNAKGAMTTYRVGLTMIFTTACTVAIFLVALKDVLPWVFTNEPEIKDIVSSILPLIACFQIFDGLAAVSSGALRGAGHQVTGACVCIFGFYVLALPIGISLAFTTSLRVMGFWVGLLIGMSAETVIYITFVFRLDWEKECIKAQGRAGISMTQPHQTEAEPEDDDKLSQSEKSPLISGSFRSGDQSKNPARYAHSTLGTLRGGRMTLTQQTAVPTETYDPSKFGQVAMLRVVTYILLLILLLVGIMLHICLPLKPGDQFCYRAPSSQANYTSTSAANFSMLSTVYTEMTSVSLY